MNADVMIMPTSVSGVVFHEAQRLSDALRERGVSAYINLDDVRLGYKLRDMRLTKPKYAVAVSPKSSSAGDGANFWMKFMNGTEINSDNSIPVDFDTILAELTM